MLNLAVTVLVLHSINHIRLDLREFTLCAGKAMLKPRPADHLSSLILFRVFLQFLLVKKTRLLPTKSLQILRS